MHALGLTGLATTLALSLTWGLQPSAEAPLLSNLSRDDETASVMLTSRVHALFPAGTLERELETELKRQGFGDTRSHRGLRSAAVHGPGFWHDQVCQVAWRVREDRITQMQAFCDTGD